MEFVFLCISESDQTKHESYLDTITTDEDADNGEWTISSGATLDVETLESLFQHPPICPVAGNTIVVTIGATNFQADEEGYKVTTACNKSGSEEVHGS